MILGGLFAAGALGGGAAKIAKAVDNKAAAAAQAEQEKFKAYSNVRDYTLDEKPVAVVA
jgi:hypothetical protein